MACIINLFDLALIGEDTGGILTFEFYDADQDGLPDTGGTTLIPDSNGNINVDNAIPGDYYFKYAGGELPDCYSETPFYVRVVEQVNAGFGQTIQLCTGDSVNLFSLLNGTPDDFGVWTGDGTQSLGYSNEGTPIDPTDDTFDSTGLAEGIYEFIYTVFQPVPDGFDLVDCENCASSTTTVTIQVIDCSPPIPCDSGTPASVSVCASVGCQFDLFDLLGGSPDSGGTWQWESGPQVIIPTNGDQGTVNFLNANVGVYQFSYTVDTCTTFVTVTVVATPWAGTNGSVNLCESSGAVNLFQYLGGSPNSGGTWTISPGLPAGQFLPNGTINPAPGDSGAGSSASYTATYTVSNPVNGPCGTVCTDTSTVLVTIYENCFAGTDTTITICLTDSVTLNPATLLGATSTGGTWFCLGQSINCNNNYGAALFSVNGGPVQNWQADPIPNNAVLDEFQSLGCILLQYTCQVAGNPACNDIAELLIHIVNCSPPCNSTVTIQATGCALSIATLTNCPSPIYQWQIFQGGNWIPAPGVNNNNTYTGTTGNQYRLRVTGCPNCNPIFSNSITVSCVPPPSCSITCVLTYNTTLQRLQAVITNSGAASCSVPYQFNRANTNNANCALCAGWQVATCSGNVVVPALGSVQVNCVVAQQATEQCFRFVTLASCCNQTTCCVKIPAVALFCWELPSLPPFTDITQITVNAGAGNVNIMTGANNFNCTEYESTQPNGTMNGNINCSLAQAVIDVNAWLVANGHSGTMYIIQKAKSSSLRVQNTNIQFVSVTSVAGGTIPFAASGCNGCDTSSWHFQGLSTSINFSTTVGVNGYLNPSVAGTINLFTLLDLYFGGTPVQLPHTGTFTAAICTTATTGCVDVNTNCWSDCVPPPATPVTVVNNVGNSDHGDLNWIVFTPINAICFWQIRYSVTLPNGCTECILISVDFNDNI